MTAAIPQKEEKQPLSPSPSPSPSPPGSITGVEMALALENVTPELPLTLPPGVYFDPTKPESVQNYLDRWIAGDAMPDAVGWVVEDDVYGEHPDALVRKYRPASTRNSEPSWWFLCHCKLQPTRGRAAGRCDRRVDTGGHWKLEQTKQAVECEASGRQLGFKRSFGFYLSHGKGGKEEERHKTWWLMEEYTSVACPDDGVARADGKRVLPALCRLYVTPRDPRMKEQNSKKKKRGRDEDDGEDDDDDGAPMMAGPMVVPAAYFDAVAALLPPPSSVLGAGQEQAMDAQEAPPPSSVLGVAQEQTAPPHQQPGVVDPYQRNDASPEDIMAWETGRGDGLADSSWIDEHYAKPEPID